jgi:tetratricopeptide (TPR) repeat protein
MAATLLVYWPALRNGFVWDDTALVLRDPLIRSWRLIPEGFQHFLFLDATASNFYRPIQRLSFTVDYALSAFKPADWHFTSIAVHAAAATALFWFLRRWWGVERWRWALGVALIWALHPLHTSAVTYVAGRADPLAALFGFTALGIALTGTPLALAGAGICFLCALLSKESGGMALAIWFIILACRGAERRAWLQWGAIALIVLGAYSALRFSAQKTPPPPPSQSTAANAMPVLVSRAIAEYAGLIIAPMTLRMERDVSDAGQDHASAKRTWQTVVGAALIAGLFSWWLWARRRAPLASAALLAGAAAYLPISNLFTLNATVAEHWLYVPSAFLFAAAAQSLAAAPRWLQRSAFVLISGWILCLGARTRERQKDWIDQRTFLTQTIAAGGDSARMRVNLGNLELSEGQPERAIAEYDLALARNPTLVFAHFGRATALAHLGDFPNARAALDRCGTGRGLDADILHLRAAIDSAEHKIDPIPAYRAAADMLPLNWKHRKRYLTALAESGRLNQAISELRDFLDTQPFRADSWLLLATYLSRSTQRDFTAMALAEARARDVHLRVELPAANSSGGTTPP